MYLASKLNRFFHFCQSNLGRLQHKKRALQSFQEVNANRDVDADCDVGSMLQLPLQLLALLL